MSTTHQLVRDGQVVTKRYVSWDRDEHRREWAVLARLHEHADDLAPRPLAADLEAEPPWISMSLLPGEPVRGRYPARQLDALEAALRELWSVPPAGLDRPRIAGIRDLLTARRRPRHGTASTAYDAAVRWWSGPEPERLATPAGVQVLGHGDPNLANYLWDGQRIRVVDFEDAGRSDVAFELATLVEHLAARDMVDPGFCQRFDVDEPRLLAARRLWAIFWLQMLLPGGPAADRNPPETLDAQAERLLDLL